MTSSLKVRVWASLIGCCFAALSPSKHATVLAGETDGSITKVLQILESCPRPDNLPRNDPKRAAIIKACYDIATFDLDQIRQAAVDFSATTKPLDGELARKSVVLVLNRYLFNVPNKFTPGDRWYPGWLSNDKTDEHYIWPLRINLRGELEFWGFVGAYSGANYDAVGEFDHFRKKFGRRAIFVLADEDSGKSPALPKDSAPEVDRSDVAKVLKLLESCPRPDGMQKGDVKRAEVLRCCYEIASFEMNDIREAVSRFVKIGTPSDAIRRRSVILVLNRYLFNVQNKLSKGDPWFHSWVAFDKTDAIYIWPLRITPQGELEFWGFVGMYSGPSYDALKEFDTFRSKFGRRAIFLTGEIPKPAK